MRNFLQNLNFRSRREFWFRDQFPSNLTNNWPLMRSLYRAISPIHSLALTRTLFRSLCLSPSNTHSRLHAHTHTLPRTRKGPAHSSPDSINYESDQERFLLMASPTSSSSPSSSSSSSSSSLSVPSNPLLSLSIQPFVKVKNYTMQMFRTSDELQIPP